VLNIQQTNKNALTDAIIEGIPYYIFWKDCNSVYLGGNTNFTKLVGLDKPDDVIGLTDYDLAWGPGEAAIFRADDRATMNGENKVNGEEELHRPDGTVINMLVSKVRLVDGNNDCIGVIGISTDITHIKKLQADLEKAKQIAQQAAHDIRSPLAAFNVVLQQLEQFPEQQRNLIRNATRRINDIANNLLLSSQQHKKNNDTQPQTESLYGLLDSILSEKRAQFTRRDIDFDLNIQHDTYSVFVEVNPVAFKRVLSNLINNAVEAIEEHKHGQINITVSLVQNNVMINIHDNGKGIPDAIIHKIVEAGYSYGKSNGTGLGLTFAMNKIQEWHGSYNISSKENDGSTISITLPKANTAKWFADAIDIPQEVTVIVLDDDSSIHQVWDSRLNDHTIQHFYYADKFIEYVKSKNDKHSIYLVDYELIGSEENGIELIEQHGLIQQSYLVTSRYEDEMIRTQCEKLGLKIVPKPYSVHIPILST
tara:strand:- start:35346 stop:36782 length:1437 start_codon:yes stop_codon:yes gene_type:complete